MKLLFSSDDYCYCADGKYYLREFGDTLLKRYLMVFDTIRVAIRTKYVSNSDLGIYNILVDMRVEIYPLPFFQGPKQYLSVYMDTCKRIENITQGCEVCIVRMPSSIAYKVLQRAKMQKIPYGIEVVANPQDLALQGDLKAYFFWSILHKNLKKMCAGADCISYVTQHFLQKKYPSLKKDHFETYYSSVDLDDTMFVGSRSNVNSPFVICHISNPIVMKGKGHDILIKTAAVLIGKGYDIQVKIAGNGPAVEYYRLMADGLGIGNRLTFAGFLEKKQLREFLIDSDLMLLPTLSEGLPRVIIEAMATGMPCLSTPVGGIPELLSADCLFAPNDVVGFASRVEQFIQDKELYITQSKANFNKSLEYKSEVLTQRRREMYEALKSKVRK